MSTIKKDNKVSFKLVLSLKHKRNLSKEKKNFIGRSQLWVLKVDFWSITIQ
jgi:hypothetical protein